jgi:hypothetical protein
MRTQNKARFFKHRRCPAAVVRAHPGDAAAGVAEVVARTALRRGRLRRACGA